MIFFCPVDANFSRSSMPQQAQDIVEQMSRHAPSLEEMYLQDGDDFSNKVAGVFGERLTIG